jgi:DNA-binding NarL/FixJ family response regulator
MATRGLQRRVLLVEDEPLLRSLIASKLESDGFQVSAAATAAEARKVADDFDPDVALLDIDLGTGPTGMDLAAALQKSDPSLAIVFLTHLSEPRLSGYTTKDIPKGSAYLVKAGISDPDSLVDAINAAARKSAGKNFRDDKKAQHRFSDVSNSQLEVIRMLAQGLSNAEIAELRNTTVRAVENLVKRALTAAGIEETSNGSARVQAALEFVKIAGFQSRV